MKFKSYNFGLICDCYINAPISELHFLKKYFITLIKLSTTYHTIVRIIFIFFRSGHEVFFTISLIIFSIKCIYITFTNGFSISIKGCCVHPKKGAQRLHQRDLFWTFHSSALECACQNLHISLLSRTFFS